MMGELAEALRDVIRDAPEEHVDSDPEEAFLALARQLILELSKRTLTILPTAAPGKGEAAERTFTILTRWLSEHGSGHCFVSKFDHPATLPFLFFVNTPEKTYTFRGSSAQDAHAQAAQAIAFEAL